MTSPGHDGNNQYGLPQDHTFRGEKEPKNPERAAPGEEKVEHEADNNGRDRVEGLDEDDDYTFAPEFVKMDESSQGYGNDGCNNGCCKRDEKGKCSNLHHFGVEGDDQVDSLEKSCYNLAHL